jgi:hypothetical protein
MSEFPSRPHPSTAEWTYKYTTRTCRIGTILPPTGCIKIWLLISRERIIISDVPNVSLFYNIAFLENEEIQMNKTEFKPEDGGGAFLRNVGSYIQDYTVNSSLMLSTISYWCEISFSPWGKDIDWRCLRTVLRKIFGHKRAGGSNKKLYRIA